MSLQAFLATLDGAEEAVKSLYKPLDAADLTKGYLLDVTPVEAGGVKHALQDNTNLLTALTKERENVAESQKAGKEALDQLKVYIDLGTAEEIAAKLAAPAPTPPPADGKPVAPNEAELSAKIEAEQKSIYEKKMAEETKAHQATLSELNKARIVNDITAAIAKGAAEEVKIVPVVGAEKTVIDKVSAMVSFDDNNQMCILDSEGKPRLAAGSSFDKMGIEEAYRVFAADEANNFMFQGENKGGAGGTGGTGGGGGGGGGPVTADQFYAMGLDERGDLYKNDKPAFETLTKAVADPKYQPPKKDPVIYTPVPK